MINVMFTNSSAKEIKTFKMYPFAEAYQLTKDLEKAFAFQNRVESVDFFILDEDDTELYKGTLSIGQGYAESIYHHVVKKLAVLTDHQSEEKKTQKQAFLDLLKAEISDESTDNVKVIEKLISVTPQAIAFVSLSKGAGATFHATNFAAFLAEQKFSVGLYEDPVSKLGKTYLKDVFDTQGITYNSVPHLISEGSTIPLNKTFMYKKLAVYPTDYGKGLIGSFTISQMFQYLNTGKHTFKIFDLGYYDLEDSQLLQTFDQIYVLIDLTPTSFIVNYKRLEWLLNQQSKQEFPNIHFILNPGTKACKKQELGLKDAFTCPCFNKDEMLIAHFKRELLYFEVEEAQNTLRKLYYDMCKVAEIPLVQTQKKGLLKRLMVH